VKRANRIGAFHHVLESCADLCYSGLGHRANDGLLAREIVIEVAGTDLRFGADI